MMIQIDISSSTKLSSQKPTIGIVGFGYFGQFLAKRYISQGHRVIGIDGVDRSKEAADISCELLESSNKLMNEDPHVVMFSTSITSLHKVLSKFPVQRLANTLVVDVLSVKMFPRELLLRTLPLKADILCTHPMFGPVSGEGSLDGLSFMYDTVRVNPSRAHICYSYIDIYRREQCQMISMSCKQHDQQAAESQFLTHMTGRMLSSVGVRSTRIDTAAFGSLLQITDNCMKDSNDLFYRLYIYNPVARQVLKNLQSSLRAVREQLECEKTRQKEERGRPNHILTVFGIILLLTFELQRSDLSSAENRQHAVVDDILTTISSASSERHQSNIRHDVYVSIEAIRFVVRLSKSRVCKSKTFGEIIPMEATRSFATVTRSPKSLINNFSQSEFQNHILPRKVLVS